MVCLFYGGMDETLWLPKTMVILKLSEMGDLHLIFVTTVTINGNASIRIATTMTTILAGLASSQASSAGPVARVMSTTKKDSPLDCNRTGHQWRSFVTSGNCPTLEVRVRLSYHANQSFHKGTSRSSRSTSPSAGYPPRRSAGCEYRGWADCVDSSQEARPSNQARDGSCYWIACIKCRPECPHIEQQGR